MPVSPWMNDDLIMLQGQVAKFIAKEFAPQAERWAEQGFVDRSAWRLAAEAGLLCASIPEEYGGAGGDYGHEAVIQQELSRAGLGGGFGIGNSVSSGVVAHYILAYGTEVQKRRWLPRMATGELVGAVAMTEPGTGSDLRSIKTSAVRDGDGYLLNGQKTFISNGQTADLIVVAAKNAQDAGPKGLSLVVVETEKAKGFRRGRKLRKLGLPAQDTSELFFDDVRLPSANLLGEEEGRGFHQLTEQLAWERLSIALNCAIELERAVEVTAEYVSSRPLFGKRLSDFQNTQFRLAEAKTLSAVARTFVDEAMVLLLKAELSAERAAMAKWWVSDTLGKVADECLQLHGGYGYMAEYPIAQIWADARATRIYGGSNETMKSIIAKTLTREHGVN